MSLVKDKTKSREDGPGVVKEEEEEEAKEERDLLGETEGGWSATVDRQRQEAAEEMATYMDKLASLNASGIQPGDPARGSSCARVLPLRGRVFLFGTGVIAGRNEYGKGERVVRYVLCRLLLFNLSIDLLLTQT